MKTYDEDKKLIPSADQEEEIRKTKLTLTETLITAFCGVLLTLGVAWLRGVFEQTTFSEVSRVLSDAFLVTAALFMGIAGLTWISTFGMYDIMGFGCSSLFGRFIPFDSVHKRKESYYDYKTKRDTRGRVWKIDMLVVGGICMVLSFLFAFLC